MVRMFKEPKETMAQIAKHKILWGKMRKLQAQIKSMISIIGIIEVPKDQEGECGDDL